MKKETLWVLVIILLPSLQLVALPMNNCPNVSIESDDGELEIEGLTAPIEIVKVFNKSYDLIYQCMGDCEEEIELSNLVEGVYNIDIQSYTSNWQYICGEQKSITIQADNDVSCSDIDLTIDGNSLILSNLDAPNTIVKVFDVFYNLIDICFASCGETRAIPNLLSGIYNIDIQFYSANWEFICDKKVSIQVDLEAEPCDNSACNGTVLLTKQEDLDEFCACKNVKGDLIIGSENGSNITTLSNLRNIEQINGSLKIQGTQITNFDGLGNLGKIGKDLIITKNQLLISFQGLNNLTEIGENLSLDINPLVQDLTGLDRLIKAQNIDLKNNNNFRNADKLAQIENIRTLSIIGNQNLKTLPNLPLLTALFGLKLTDNTKFENLSFLSDIDYLEGDVYIQRNASLSDCCGLYHLIDDDPFFGTNNANFFISNNPFACKDLTAVLANCQGAEPDCSDIEVTADNGKISVKGLTAPNEIVKIFDEQYNNLFNCFGDCENEIALTALSPGLYRIYVNFYNQNWVPICETIVTVNLNVHSGHISFSDRAAIVQSAPLADFTIAPNPASGTTYIDLKSFEEKEVHLQLINQFGLKVWQKEITRVSRQAEKIDLRTFQNGLYFLQIQSAGARGITKKIMIANLY